MSGLAGLVAIEPVAAPIGVLGVTRCLHPNLRPCPLLEWMTIKSSSSETTTCPVCNAPATRGGVGGVQMVSCEACGREIPVVLESRIRALHQPVAD